MVGISDYFCKLTGKIPDKTGLEDHVRYCRRGLKFAKKGRHIDYQFHKRDFDITSKIGKAYIRECEKQLTRSQQRLDFFYPASPQNPDSTLESNQELSQ